MNIFEFVERNDNGEKLFAKNDKCPMCGNLDAEGRFCVYWKKTLVVIDGSPTYGICSGFTTKKAKIITIADEHPGDLK